jgi:hypothetical protein
MREDRPTISAKRNNETKKENQIGKLNMNAILEFAAFRRERKIVEENFVTASDLKPEPCVALVTGGAVLGLMTGCISISTARTRCFRWAKRGNSQQSSKESPMRSIPFRAGSAANNARWAARRPS